jgi:hypothetical protein
MAIVLPWFTSASGIPFLQDHTSPVFATNFWSGPCELHLAFQAMAHHVVRHGWVLGLRSRLVDHVSHRHRRIARDFRGALRELDAPHPGGDFPPLVGAVALGNAGVGVNKAGNVAAVANPGASAERRSMSSMRCLLSCHVRPHRAGVLEVQTLLPRITGASAGASLLSNPVERGPNWDREGPHGLPPPTPLYVRGTYTAVRQMKPACELYPDRMLTHAYDALCGLPRCSQGGLLRPQSFPGHTADLPR